MVRGRRVYWERARNDERRRNRVREYCKKWRAKKRSLGLCSRCGIGLTDGHSTCEVCSGRSDRDG